MLTLYTDMNRVSKMANILNYLIPFIRSWQAKKESSVIRMLDVKGWDGRTFAASDRIRRYYNLEEYFRVQLKRNVDYLRRVKEIYWMSIQRGHCLASSVSILQSSEMELCHFKKRLLVALVYIDTYIFFLLYSPASLFYNCQTHFVV